MRALCALGLDVICSAVGRPSGIDAGMDTGPRGVVFVGALLMYSDIRVLTFLGVTFSITMKAGSSRTVVGSA